MKSVVWVVMIFTLVFYGFTAMVNFNQLQKCRATNTTELFYNPEIVVEPKP
jgi:hypothetical protein